MPDDFTPVRARFRWGRVLGWGLIVALVAAGGWSGWRAYDYRAAVREARAAGLRFEESPTPLAAVRADWHAAFRIATWTEHKRRLELSDGTDLAPLRPLLLRLDPTFLHAEKSRNVDAVRGLTRLRWLDLTGAEVKDLAPLAGLTRLRYLSLFGCKGVADLAPLAGLTQLQELSYAGKGVTDLTPLAGLTRLRLLSVGEGVKDLAPLAGLTQLEMLYLPRSGGPSPEVVEAFQKSHPHTTVIGS